MMRLKVKVNRGFFHILAALILWTSIAPIAALMSTKPWVYGALSALFIVTATVVMVSRHRVQGGRVSVLQSSLFLFACLTVTIAPITALVALARYFPIQYSALAALYVLGIVGLVVAAIAHLRTGIIEHRRGQGARQDISPSRSTSA